MTSRTLVAVILGIALLATLLFIVVIPGVERGGWLEIAGVFAFVAAFAVGDRWIRRVLRRR